MASPTGLAAAPAAGAAIQAFRAPRMVESKDIYPVTLLQTPND